MLDPRSNTAEGLQAIRLATLLKRNPRTSVLERAVRKCSLIVFLYILQILQENTCAEFSF